MNGYLRISFAGEWKHLADDGGFHSPANDAHLRGVGRRESLLYLLRWRPYAEAQLQEMMERKKRSYQEFIEHMTTAELIPGGQALLQEIRRQGMKIAIASGSKNCRTVLEHVQIVPLFDGIADGNSVVNSTSAADIFVYAAGLVNVPTPACLGVEDADAGIEAIKAAGMQALGTGPRERFHHADAVLPSLANQRLVHMLNAEK